MSSNPKVLPSFIAAEAARGVLSALRDVGGHRFLPNDVSPADANVPPMAGHRQVTDALLLTLARRNAVRLVTFDAGILALAEGRDVELLGTLSASAVAVTPNRVPSPPPSASVMSISPFLGGRPAAVKPV